MTNELARPAQQAGAPDRSVRSGSVPDGTSAPPARTTAISPAGPSASRPGGRRYRTRPARGRRYRAGRPAGAHAAAVQPADAQPGVQVSSFPALASMPRALARMFAVCLVSCLLAAWLHLDLIAGLGFCAGCVLATRYSRPGVLLHVVLSLPVIFLAAELVAELVTAGGGTGHRTVLSVLEGTLLTLAAVAPWLFAGTAGGFVIAMFRGLPQCVRDLRAEGRGTDRPPARSGGGSDRLAWRLVSPAAC